MLKAYVFSQLSAVASSMDTTTPIGERLALGGKTLFNFLIVMAVLALLWGSLELFRVLLYELPKKRAAKKAKAAAEIAEPEAAEIAEPALVPEPALESALPTEDDGEICAAITAAVYVYLDGEARSEGKPSYTGGFRVVSFRKV